MAGGVPRLFGDEQPGESVRHLGFWLEGNFDDQLIAGLFSFRRLELVDVVTVRSKKGKRTDIWGVGDGKFEKSIVESDFDEDHGDPDGHFASDLVKEALQVDVGFGLGEDDEIELGFAGQAGLLADEPFDGSLNGDLRWKGLVLGWGDLDEENGFLLVSITEERGDENLFREGKLEFAGGPSGGKFPSHVRGKTRVPGIFPIDMPTGDGTKTKPDGHGLPRFHGFWFGQQVHSDLGCLGDRTSPERGLE